MSYFDDASLVMIPSGYKTSKVYSVKPTDGSGDLTFSRSNDTATRVNSAGLIEKVRTNLILQSNTFNTTWAITGIGGATVTSGQADPDGGTSAWLLAKGGTSGRIEQNIAMATNEQTFSIVAKKGTSNFLYVAVFDGTTTHSSYFNLDTGVVGTQSSAVASMVSVGSGWYRCSLTSTNASATGVIQLYISDNNGAVSGTTGDIYIYQSQFENGVATDYIVTTSAAVSVGPVANVPRLDYLGSTCGKLILEPQRTNLFTYSEQLDNAAWTKYNLGVTANATISPDGYQNADKIFCNITGSAVPLIHQSPSYTNTTSTVSGYFKKAEYNFVVIHAFGIAGTVFNLNTGTIVSGAGTITSVGNGWYRCVAVLNIGSDSQTFFTPSVDGSVGYTGTSGSGVFAWGAQAEASVSYATSYIPTLGSASTRGKDSCLTASVPSLIGQTEGTMFIEFERKSLAALSLFILSNVAGTTANSYQNSIYIYQASSIIVVEGFISNVQQFAFSTSSLSVGTHKIAIAYKANDFALYIDGVQIGTDTSGSIPAMNFFTIAGSGDVTDTAQAVSQALLFKTRLSNSSLAELTSL